MPWPKVRAKVALHPERLPFGEQVNGLEVMLKRCIYTPTEAFSKRPVARMPA